MQKHHSFYCLFPSWTSGERRIQKPASPTLHYMSPNFIFNFPKTEERIQIKNWFLRTECLEHSILLKGAPMQSSNLVMIHGKAGFQRAKYSQVMTQKRVPHVLIPCSYTTLCVHLQTTPIDSTDINKTVRIPATEIQYRCVQESWILFCYYQQQNHQLRFGSESSWMRTM